MENNSRFLIIRPDAMGDFISVIPVIKSIKANFPDAFVGILGSNANMALVEYLPEINCFLNKDSLKYKEILKEAKALHFDYALVYNHDTKWAYLPLLTGIPNRVGDKCRVALSWLFNKGVYIMNADHSKHVIEYNLEYLKCLGIKTIVKDIKINIEQVKPNQSLPKTYIVIHIGHLGGSGGRLWSIKAYADIINMIHSTLDMHIVLTGQLTDFAHNVSNLVINKKMFINLVGKTSIPELIAVLKYAKAYIGTDTGVTHLAACCNIPSVFIMGVKAIKPVRWYPWGVPVVIVRTEVHCPFVCNFASCKHEDCFDGISTEEIVNGLSKLLEGKSLTNNAFEKSMSVLNIYDNKTAKIAEDLGILQTKLGIRAININYFNLFHLRKIWALCIKEDITIIHCLAINKYPLAWVLSKLLALVLFVEPLLIKGTVEIKNSKKLVEFYKKKFGEISLNANKMFY